MLDAYARRARLAPVALAAFPALALAGGAVISIEQSGSAAALVVAALGLLVCGAVRDAGLHLQRALWRRWGGAPTTRRLRWADSDPDEVGRRHRRIAEVLGVQLPTASAEAADPKAADREYEAAVRDLRELTRDDESFPLIAEENAEYGFRRNCLGIRSWALSLSAATLLTSIAVVAVGGPVDNYLFSGILSVLAVGLWWLWVTPQWVADAAERYADRLMDSLVLLERQR